MSSISTAPLHHTLVPTARPTFEEFHEWLTRLTQAINALDPAGTDWTMRLTVSLSLYVGFDEIRCQDRPFDRTAFANRLSLIEQLVRQYPGVVTQRPTGVAQDRRKPEEVVAELYSRCWNHYDDQAFMETVELFEERFRFNQIDLNFLNGAECLDAGCGSGRYTIAMAKLGARRAVGIDISERAIQEAAERSRRLGFSEHVEFCHGSVLKMPQEWTGTFDFVCSNGVAHHTQNPSLALQEIFRVLKPGGRAYIFVYGSGGLFWAVVDVIRVLVAPIPMTFTDCWLQSLGLPPGKIFNFMDHWYTPIQERITRHEFEARLRSCGFVDLVYLPRAKIYDASERRFRFPEERDLVGEGDLRYWVRKPAR